MVSPGWRVPSTQRGAVVTGLLNSVGAAARRGRKVAWRARGALHRAPQAKIASGVSLGGPGHYEFGASSVVHRGVQAHVASGARFVLGPGSAIGDRSIINCASEIVIGSGTQLSWNVQLLDTDFHPVRRPDGTLTKPTAPIHIGDGVLVGTGAIILKGVTIGDGAVIGAGAVVRRDVPARMIAIGNPARVVGEGTAVF